jgi:hypothetical protein
VDSKEQNREVEYRSKMALLGGYIDWRTTPISETPQAIATDPVRIATRPSWWRDAEPRDLFGREIIQLLERDARRHARDGKTEEQQSIAPRVKDRAKGKRDGAADKDPLAEYMPEPGDNAWQWCDQLAIKVDTNKNLSWYQALRSYVHKFAQTTLAKELDQKTVSKFLKEICGGEQ